MKRILTALTAATILALALTANARAGHHTSHPNTQPTQQHGNQFIGNDVHTNNVHQTDHNEKISNHTSRHDHLRSSDCCYFRYRCWCPNCDTYIFWYPSDCCWYYWCADRGCYLPYDQVTIYPPTANVVPEIPGGLPPAVPGGNDDGPSTGDDGPPPPPPFVPGNNLKKGKGGPPPVSGGNDNGPKVNQDGPPPMPPADIKADGRTAGKNAPPANPFDN